MHYFDENVHGDANHASYDCVIYRLVHNFIYICTTAIKVKAIMKMMNMVEFWPEFATEAGAAMVEFRPEFITEAAAALLPPPFFSRLILPFIVEDARINLFLHLAESLLHIYIITKIRN